jgi:hypothetical protein
MDKPITIADEFRAVGEEPSFCPHINQDSRLMPSDARWFHVGDNRVLVMCSICHKIIVGDYFMSISQDIERNVLSKLEKDITAGVRLGMRGQ